MRHVKFRAFAAGIVMVTSTLTSCSTLSEQTSRCAGSTADNRAIVLNFYREALVDLQPRSAFDRYMSADFVEHKPDVPGGTREATAAYLAELIAELPKPRWEMLRVAAEGDLVFLHIRFTPAPDAPAYAIVDVFRVKDCKIVEHWDVVASPPREAVNPNPRF